MNIRRFSKRVSPDWLAHLEFKNGYVELMNHPGAAFYYKLFALVNFSFLLIQNNYSARLRREGQDLIDRLKFTQDLEFKVTLHSEIQHTKRSLFISYGLMSVTCIAMLGGLILSNRHITRIKLHDSGKMVQVRCLDFFGFGSKESELKVDQIISTRRFHPKIWFYQLEIEKERRGDFKRRSLFYRPYNLIDQEVWRRVTSEQVEQHESKPPFRKKK